MRLKWVGEVKDTKEAQAVYVPREGGLRRCVDALLEYRGACSGNLNKALDMIKTQHKGMSMKSLLSNIGRHLALSKAREERQVRKPLRRIACK